ncbi:hypothetical protein [Alteromonas stellipolaris]|nr:hypothetical protein [Alteromonas stellipolaris]MDP2534673.1 hypothetical protein [Alteromonas stellipolaris]
MAAQLTGAFTRKQTFNTELSGDNTLAKIRAGDGACLLSPQ